MANVWNEFALPLAGCLTAIFVGWVWRKPGAMSELRADGARFPAPEVWAFLIRWICPAAIALILATFLASML